jgi:hypothetical protein
MTANGTTQPPIDIYSAGHAGIGAIMGLAGLSLPAAGGLIVYINFIASDLAGEAPGLFGGAKADDWQNSVLDAAASMAGYYWGRSRYEDKPNARR